MTGLHAMASWLALHEPTHQSVCFHRHTLVETVSAEQDIEVPPILGDPEACLERHAHCRTYVVPIGARWVGEGIPVPRRVQWVVGVH
jgi:hypothetical protein